MWSPVQSSLCLGCRQWCTYEGLAPSRFLSQSWSRGRSQNRKCSHPSAAWKQWKIFFFKLKAGWKKPNKNRKKFKSENIIYYQLLRSFVKFDFEISGKFCLFGILRHIIMRVCYLRTKHSARVFIHGSLPLAGLPRICNTSFHSWGAFHLQVCHVSATQAFIHGGPPLAGLPRICNTSFHLWESSTCRFATYLQHKRSFMSYFHLQVCHVSATQAFIR
jgi:hypothetical protein